VSTATVMLPQPHCSICSQTLASFNTLRAHWRCDRHMRNMHNSHEPVRYCSMQCEYTRFEERCWVSADVHSANSAAQKNQRRVDIVCNVCTACGGWVARH
jgi:hypothetical protein